MSIFCTYAFRRASFGIAPLCVALTTAVAAAQQQAAKPVARSATSTSGSKSSAKAAAESRRRRVDYIDAQSLISISRGLVQRNAVGHSIHTSADDQTTYLLVRRVKSSEPEVHARWDDLVIIRSGKGAIEMGDSLVGSRYRAPGERIGGKFAKPFSLVVNPGDIVRLPATVPHAFVVSGSEPLEYLVIKERRQSLPIRWFGEP